MGFVDSDDWIDPDMYERMLTLAEREDADVTVCGLVFDFEDPKIPKRNEISNFKKEVYDRKDLEALFPTLINDGYFFGRTLQPARVTKLFRAKLLLQNVQFCDDQGGGGRGSADHLPGASGYAEAVRGAGFLSLSLLD